MLPIHLLDMMHILYEWLWKRIWWFWCTL